MSTPTEALDELADVRMTLNGLAALTLAFANSGMHEPEAVKLVSCLLDYCALGVSSSSEVLKGGGDTNAANWA